VLGDIGGDGARLSPGLGDVLHDGVEPVGAACAEYDLGALGRERLLPPCRWRRR